jgi:hypothetical protein
MYNSKLECTYSYYDANLKQLSKPISDELSLLLNADCENHEDYAEILYHSDFLNAFNLKEYDNDYISKSTTELYNKISNIEKLNELFKKLSGKFVSEDPEIGFTLLFSYNYFFLLHPCICDFLNTGEIKEENYKLLSDGIEKQ